MTNDSAYAIGLELAEIFETHEPDPILDRLVRLIDDVKREETLSGSPDDVGEMIFRDQPDYHLREGLNESAIPRLICEAWIDGDDEEREWVDDFLRRSRRQFDRDMNADHHQMVFGAKAWF